MAVRSRRRKRRGPRDDFCRPASPYRVLRADAGGVRLDQTRGDAGQVAHLEIPAQDTRSAREFWGGLFGWEWQQFEGPSEYHMTRIDDRSGAAIMAAR
jgi:hypothetical protein